MNLSGQEMEGKEGIEALFLYATEGILVVNENGEIVRINPSAEKLFGYESQELIGKKIEVLIPKRLSDKHVGYREKYNQNPHARSMGSGIDLFGRKKDGSEMPVEISLSPYTVPEGKFVIAFVVDITVRKLAEEKLRNYSSDLEKQVRDRTLILEEAIAELEKTKEELHRALDKEKELNELKSRFVSIASHEFRTPLTTMMSSLSLVTKYNETNDKEGQVKHISKIKKSIDHLTDILNDFLSVSRLEEGRIENNPSNVNLEAFIEEVVSEMRPMAVPGQQIVYQYSGNRTGSLDGRLLRNILFNLISNAIKFSPGGEDILVKAEATNSLITVNITDKGIGIPVEDQKHLFERFFRGRNAMHIQGTGLGLNIVTKYIELMNGTISMQSREKEGTTFLVTIPVQP